MTYEILKGVCDSLITPCEVFDFNNPPFDPEEFAVEIVKLMRDNEGIGLAANQLGVPYRIFALRSDPNKVLFNPRIVMYSDEEEYMEEGCLSFPGVVCKIKRPKNIRIRYMQANQETKTDMFSGLTSRICQHEMDHLDGIIFYNRATRYHREQALKKYAEMQIRIPQEDYVYISQT